MKDNKDKIMRQEIINILSRNFTRGDVQKATNEILSLLAENPEVVSDASLPSGVYTQVRERDESGQDGECPKASVTVPLGNMIGSERFKEALIAIERICDGNNPAQEEIWHIAYSALNESKES